MLDEYEQHLSDYLLEFRDDDHPWPWTFGHTFSFVVWVYSTIGEPIFIYLSIPKFW